MGRSIYDHLVNNRFTRPTRIKVERKALEFRAIRFLANRYYNATTNAGRVAIYNRSAKMFRGHSANFGSEDWLIKVPPFCFKLPLRGKDAWLDWDLALSTLGHDPEIKDFYAKLLRSEFRPDLFIDVGANYGLDSALFLSAGISCVAFEPNESCARYIQRIADLNGFRALRVERVALGAEVGEADLIYPQSDTWQGTMNPTLATALTDHRGELVVERVPVRRLDDIVIDHERSRCFVKIDVEGLEISVIRGAHNFLRDECDFFVFETLPFGHPADHRDQRTKTEERKDLYSEISAIGFSIEALPIGDIHQSAPLDEETFIRSCGTNFLARKMAPSPSRGS